MIFLKAVLLAVVEGATEFLPVSSTGHLILVEEVLKLSASADFNHAFMIVIQLPAIGAVVVYFWRDLWPFSTTGSERSGLYALWGKIFAAFAPAAVFGYFLNDYLEARLLKPAPVGTALLLGGIFLVLVDKRDHRVVFPSVADIGFITAFFIGLFQCLALFPGTSRSAATIIGAILLGLSRSAAAEFSFFLAIPTMLGAAVFTLFQHGLVFTGEEWAVLAVGSVVAFGTAYAVVAMFMRYIRRHNFVPFGYYRIGLALVVFGFLAVGWL